MQGKPISGVQALGFAPLTPVSFLERSAHVFGDRRAVVDGDRCFTYGELWDRARRQAGMLTSFGIAPGDRVAVLAPNTALLLESHYGVPLAGAVLLALNVRLSARELAYIVDHAGAEVLLVDHEWKEVAEAVASAVAGPLQIVEGGGVDDEYELLLGDAEFLACVPDDERSLLALNYTSGTTGPPKGVMYHHRGAYLQALAMAFHAGLGPGDVSLWTLPMFHCNGWCFTWALTAAGATHLCLRRVEPAPIWQHLRGSGVTHFNAAPTVLTSLAFHPDADAGPLPHPVRAGTGGAPPAPALLGRLAELGIAVTHLYGLTETFGPAVVCQWPPEWDELPLDEQARRKARQGVGNVVSQRVRVVDGDGGNVPENGSTMGEVALRGNNVMLGYYGDPEATAGAAPDGWFHTGDLGVVHPDGYVELRDRAKDVIISGGENIASIEVEQAIASHPAVLEVAVVAVPDERWGEVPKAYVTLKDGAAATAEEIIGHVQSRLARFKAPKQVAFGVLPKTSTGKIQKFLLRDEAWADHDQRIR